MTWVHWLAAAVIAVVFAYLGIEIARRVLGTPVGWGRGIAATLVGFVAVPVAVGILENAGIFTTTGLIVVDTPIAAGFLLLAVGWIFAIVLAAIVVLELLFPTGSAINPVRTVREALARRDRVRRYGDILRILSRHGISVLGRRRRGEDSDLPSALTTAMNEAGATFVKAGQVLSTRDDVLPHAFTDAFSTLQTAATPLPWADAEAAIRAQLGRPIEEVFASIDHEPLAAASVAQVHPATLRDGANVVVKIQRPNARAEVQTDLDILVRLAHDAERNTDWGREYGVSALAEEFARTLREELDYRIEVSNTELMRSSIAGSKVDVLRVPIIYREWCTPQMIVQERMEGSTLATIRVAAREPEAQAEAEAKAKAEASDPPLTRRTAHKRLGPVDIDAEVWMPDDSPPAYDPNAPLDEANARRIADEIFDAVFDQVAVQGVFHADLHPGNIVIEPNGSVALIDFGAIGILEASLRRLLITLLVAMANEDDIAATDIVLLLVDPPDDDALDRLRLRRDIGVVLTRVHNGQNSGSLFRELLGVLRRHHLAIPPALLLVFRTLGSLDGALRRIVPHYDMFRRGLARAPQIARDSMTLQGAAMTAQTHVSLTMERLRRLPNRIESIVGGLERGTLSVRVKTLDSPPARSIIRGVVTQLTTALIGVALIAVAAVLLVAPGGPALTPDVGAFGFLGALVGLVGLLLVLRVLSRSFAVKRGAD